MLLVQIFYDNIYRDERIGLGHFTQHRFAHLNEDEWWNRIEEYVQFQDDTWDEPPPLMIISSISKIIKPSFKERLKAVREKLSYLTTPTVGKSLRNLHLICDICRGTHEADEYNSEKPHEQVCLFGGDILDDPSLLRFYQNDDSPSWGKTKKRMDEEEGPNWVIRRDSKRTPPETQVPTLAITTRSGITTRNLPYLDQPSSAPVINDETTVEGEMPTEEESPTSLNQKYPQSSTFYDPSKSSNVPFPSRRKKDDEDEQFLSIFKHIHINLCRIPFNTS
ncbi:hypothetical protein Tco_0999376 [Tanacetum coccineum]